MINDGAHLGSSILTDHEIRWLVQRFDEIPSRDFYSILAARVAVFVVEQDCPYQDVDGLDFEAVHVTARSANGGVLAYARILPPGLRFAEPSIGRVLTVMPARGTGLGRKLMHYSLEAAGKSFPGQPLRISAQQYLERFYADLGFETVRGPYPEDGIPHLEMFRPATSEQ
jgi:ElaA protein